MGMVRDQKPLETFRSLGGIQLETCHSHQKAHESPEIKVLELRRVIAQLLEEGEVLRRDVVPGH